MSFDTMMARATELDDDHRGCRRQTADEGRDREHVGTCRERQREHEHVAVELSAGERQHAGHRDRHDEKVDQYEIKRKQPRGAFDLRLIVVLDHRDVKLPRQQDDCEKR